MITDSLATVLIQKALDGTWQRQRSISNNIANHETPGYKAVRVSFEQALDHEVKCLQVGFHPKNANSESFAAIRDCRIRTYSDCSNSERADGNNVNLDLENIEMARTQIQYQYLTRAMTDQYSRLRYAISEGRK